MKYRKKPVVIEAFKLNHRFPCDEWFHDAVTAKQITIYGMGKFGRGEVSCFIETLEGRMKAKLGDYIIKGVKDEIYPCKSDIFELTYEAVLE